MLFYFQVFLRSPNYFLFLRPFRYPTNTPERERSPGGIAAVRAVVTAAVLVVMIQLPPRCTAYRYIIHAATISESQVFQSPCPEVRVIQQQIPNRHLQGPPHSGANEV